MTSLLDVFSKPLQQVPGPFIGILSGEFSGTAYTGTGTAANGTANGTGNGNGGETDAERAARVAEDKAKRKAACKAKGWRWDDRYSGSCHRPTSVQPPSGGSTAPDLPIPGQDKRRYRRT